MSRLLFSHNFITHYAADCLMHRLIRNALSFSYARKPAALSIFSLVMMAMMSLTACNDNRSTNNQTTTDDAAANVQTLDAGTDTSQETSGTAALAAGETAAPVAEPITLVVYSGRKDKFVRPVMDAFTEQTGINVELYSGSAPQLLSKLEIESDNTEADLFISNEAGTLQLGADRGVFTPLNGALVTNIPARYRGVDNGWVGLSARLRVLVVNTDLVEPEDVFSVWNLVAPEYAGKIAITSSANGSFLGGAAMYLADMQPDGLEEWLVGLKLNAQGQSYAKHRMVVDEVARGTRMVGLVNHYYIYRHLDKAPDAPIVMVVPDQEEGQMGVAINASGIAQVAYSDQPAAAEQLIGFLLSAQGQQMFAEVNREYPVLPGIATPGLPAIDTLQLSPTPLGDLGAKRQEVLDIVEKSGLP